MNKLDIITQIIEADYQRLDKKFTGIIEWAVGEVCIKQDIQDVNIRMSVLLRWAIYAGSN